MSGRRFPRPSPVWLASGVASAVAAGLIVWGVLWQPAPAIIAQPQPAPVTAQVPAVAPAAPPIAAAPPVRVPEQPPATAAAEPEPAYRYEEPAAVETTPPLLPAPAVPAPPIMAPAVPPPPAAVQAPAPPPPPAYSGSPPWVAFALAGRVVPGHPAVAVVIDDMGLDRKRSARAVHLPGPLTLSWLPYAEELPAQTAAAHAAGHELMLHLPMEPSVLVNPGPNALLTSLSGEEIRKRLLWSLGRFSGFVGVNNHMGSRFTADRAAMTPVLSEIAARGLLWLDSRTTPATVGMAVATQLGMPAVGRDVFLDNDMAPAAVARSLAQLEAVAKRNGVAVAIGHPHDATLEALARWLPELAHRGITLVPLSAVVRARHPVPLQQVGDKR